MEQAELRARLQGICQAYISEELESREISVSNNDLDGIVENMSGDALSDILEASASKAVSEYQAEMGN